MISESILAEQYHGVKKYIKKTSFFRNTFFTTGLQTNPFLDLNSGFCVTFYGLLESGRDFDRGEALIAVIANQIFSKTKNILMQKKKTQLTIFIF